jgi:hypothetical protein
MICGAENGSGIARNGITIQFLAEGTDFVNVITVFCLKNTFIQGVLHDVLRNLADF